jgi:hypothetical protein
VGVTHFARDSSLRSGMTNRRSVECASSSKLS